MHLLTELTNKKKSLPTVKTVGFSKEHLIFFILKFEKPLKRFNPNLNHYPQLKLWALVKRLLYPKRININN
jgi:hypothetical protein